MTKKQELIKIFEKKHGRKPPVLTTQQIGKLEEAFSNGASDSEAHYFANVCATNFYWWQEVNPEFVERKARLKEMIKLKAKTNVIKGMDSIDPIIRNQNSKWWLERKCKNEFSLRTEQTGKDGEAIEQKVVYVEIEKEEKDGYEDHINKTIELGISEKSKPL